MIQSLELNNFQSHKNAKLDFVKGVNIILGSSRSGKTAILRGLIWNRYNKPTGLAMNSYWNRDKKKQPIDVMDSMVTFINDKTIQRQRSSEFNGYKTNDGNLEALGTEVPEEIEQIWNMSEVNIQRQFDRPFLISESAAEVARFFNKTIHLDKIDAVLSKAELKRQRTNKEIKEKTASLETLNKELNQFEWVDDAMSKITLIERIDKRVNDKKEIAKGLTSTIQYIKNVQDQINAMPKNLDVILLKMEQVSKLDIAIEAKMDQECQLANLIQLLIKTKNIIDNVPDTDYILRLMNNVETLDKSINDKIEFAKGIDILWQNIDNLQNSVLAYDTQIKEYTSKMPVTCPICGGKL
jgi:DNA repair ATPase RecN